MSESPQARTRKAVVLLGAGASIDFGAPGTAELSDAIERNLAADLWVKHTAADRAYSFIKHRLKSYLRLGRGVQPNFEQVFHCAQELLAHQPPSPRAVTEYRPLLIPFLGAHRLRDMPSSEALRALVGGITRAIYQIVSKSCDDPTGDLSPLRDTIESLRSRFITRIYTTNYDDFVLQACPDLYTGFEPATGAARQFDTNRFQQMEGEDCVFHLHGSVHFAFANPLQDTRSEISELFWFDDRKDAIASSNFVGSGLRQMDGTEFVPTAVITGMNKLALIQQRPMCHYYAALARDLMSCDLVVIAGVGMADLHLNTYLRESRRQSPPPSLIIVDLLDRLPDHRWAQLSRKELEIYNCLQFLWGEGEKWLEPVGEWRLGERGKGALWTLGFRRFVEERAQFQAVLDRLRVS